MFIRKRQVKSNDTVYTYYGVVEAFRDEGGKPRQRLLYNMGTRSSIAQCIQDAESRLAYWREREPATENGFLSGPSVSEWPVAMAGDVVAAECARLRREIAFLNDAAARMGHVR
jgi:hypothetical protein